MEVVDKCLMDSLDKWLFYRTSNSFGGLGVCLLGVLMSLYSICPKGLDKSASLSDH
jgi:hypothetical protein